MDFTEMLMQDHYNAIVDERARAIEGSRWRRSWFARKTEDCCGDPEKVCAPAAVHVNVTAGRA